jgi:ferredoxin
MRVRVDSETCTGHGRCYVLCPEIFQEDEAGYCMITDGLVPQGLEAKARRAAEACPERAIDIED